MTKSEAIAIAGSRTRLAKILGITRQAVSQWPDEIPELRELQLEKKLKSGINNADDMPVTENPESAVA